MPGMIAGKILTELRDLDLPQDVPVIGLCRKAIEHETPGGPEADEVRRNAEAVPIVNPRVHNIRHQARHQVHRAQRNTHLPEPRGNFDLHRGDFEGGAGAAMRDPCSGALPVRKRTLLRRAERSVQNLSHFRSCDVFGFR